MKIEIQVPENHQYHRKGVFQIYVIIIDKLEILTKFINLPCNREVNQ